MTDSTPYFEHRIRHDRRLTPSTLEHAGITPATRDLALLSTWAGRCILVDVNSGDVENQPEVGLDGVGLALRTPSCARQRHLRFAVSGQVGWASVWAQGDTEAQRVFPVHSNTVNTVALSPDGELLGIGTGYMPLTPELKKGAVELWSLRGTPMCISHTVLQDVCTSFLGWHPSSEYLAAFSTDGGQEEGHLWCLEVPSLQTIAAVRIPLGGMPVAVGFVDGGTGITIVGPHHVERRESPAIDKVTGLWQFDETIVHASMSVNSERVLLSTGHLISTRDGSMESIDLVPSCRATALRPGGGYLALSSGGVLRVWDQ